MTDGALAFFEALAAETPFGIYVLDSQLRVSFFNAAAAPEFPGADILFDDADRVVGVRTGDKGIDKEGKRKVNFEPGVDLTAKVTVLGEGPRGSLVKQLMKRLGLDERKAPQVYSLGVK